MFKWIKRRRRQRYLILTGVRAMPEVNLNIVESGRYGVDDHNAEAWGIAEGSQRIYDGEPVQLVTGWDCNPIDISLKSGNKAIDTTTIEQIAGRATDESLILAERRKHRNTLLLWAGIIGVILAIGIAVPVIYGITTGNIHIPVPTIIPPSLDM